jgi:hypothetical protein
MNAGEKVGPAPIRVIEIELKNPKPARPAGRNPKPDPVSISQKHNILLLENDQVRVF